METTQTKTAKANAKSIKPTRHKRLSPIAKFWATEYVEGEILDMRAVLR
jgi:hypothetical protein